MDYSCHGIFRGIYVGLGYFLAVILREKWVKKIQTFEASLVSVSSLQTGIGTREQVKFICNWRKRASLRP